ncbi:hypothetical protein WJR50_33025 [Catalinimonas sp. 4WD22]|uniref:hypothetical protein n=1 Tax=Catalinimonas locisalis TaxID=3133978 RepID=UPI0031017E94
MTLEQAQKIKEDYSYLFIDGERYIVIVPDDDSKNEYIKHLNDVIFDGTYNEDYIPKSSNENYDVIIIEYFDSVLNNKFHAPRLIDWIYKNNIDFNHKNYGLESPQK